MFENDKPNNRSEWETIDYVKTEEEQLLLHGNSKFAYQVQVAGHELFGHGSGKLLYKDAKTGKCPLELIDPLTNKTFDSCYEPGETYQNKFGDIASSYEECRADMSGLYLAHFPEFYTHFNWTKQNETELIWQSMMKTARKGILGLSSSYNPEQKKWTQAHT